MILIYILAGMLVIGIVLSQVTYSIFGELLLMAGALFLFFALASIPLKRMVAHATIMEFQSVATTAQSARTAGDGIEGAAYRMKIAEMNQWLARAQYWRETTFWIYWPAEIEELEPIR